MPGFRVLAQSDHPPGRPRKDWPEDTSSATAFTSVCINSPVYLSYLVSRCLAAGVQFRRRVVQHVSQAASLHHLSAACTVANCSGLGSLALGGVQDNNMYPVRGQIVVVRNSPGVMADTSGTSDGVDELTYIMERAAGGGTVLGGCYQPGNWDPNPDPELAVRIMKRAVELCPGLVEDGSLVDRRKAAQLEDGNVKGRKEGIEALSVVRHGVGLRPARKGGVRCEREVIDGVAVVHCYGHGGAGFQSSWGSAEAAVELIREAAMDTRTRARL